MLAVNYLLQFPEPEIGINTMHVTTLSISMQHGKLRLTPSRTKTFDVTKAKHLKHYLCCI